MPGTGDLLSTEEAAHLLSVTVQHVNRLARAGEIAKVAYGLVDRASVDRYIASHRTGRTRVWAEHTAWAAIALLSGQHVDWVGAAQVSRLRSTIREIEAVSDLVARLRDRAATRIYSGHRSAVLRLRDELVAVDRSMLGLVDDVKRVNGYLASNTLAATVRHLGLRESANGAITVRATGFDLAVVERLATTSSVLAAVDAATSLDPRERGVGERVLASAIERSADD